MLKDQEHFLKLRWYRYHGTENHDELAILLSGVDLMRQGLDDLSTLDEPVEVHQNQDLRRFPGHIRKSMNRSKRIGHRGVRPGSTSKLQTVFTVERG
jgi:hypothetical protein